MRTKEAFAAIATILALSGAAAAQTSAPASGPSPEGVVNVNTATPAELALLPGIGETKAQAIIRSRERQRFAQVDDLLRVSGIGRATLRRLRPYVTVSGDTTLRAAPHVAAPAARAPAPTAAPASARR